MRLGIRRGWRVKMLVDIGLYTPSLVHCMFVQVMVRMRSLRVNIWIVSYYLIYIFNKMLIYAFFWLLPTRSVSQIFGGFTRFCLRIGIATSKLYLSRATLISISAVPAQKYWLRLRRRQVNIKAKKGVHSVLFVKLWNFGGSLLRFLIARSRLSTYSTITLANCLAGDNLETN